MDEFERAVEDIFNALGGKMDREWIKKELRSWIAVYGLPISEAKRGIISKYGGDISSISEVFRKIEDLRPGEGRVNLKAKVISINSKEREVEGMRKIMYYGILGDETGTIPFTAWTLDVKLRKGDCVEIKNAYTREWQGHVKLVMGNNTKVSLLPPNSVEVKMEVRPAKIVELHPKMGLVEVVGKVLHVEKREVEVDGVAREVYSGILGDETGEIPFSSWDIEVKKGDTIKISGGYISTFLGMPQLVFDSRATVERVEREVEVKEIPIQIESLEGRGGFNVLIEGVVIDIKSGSGLIYRCPECGRVLRSSVCPVHGKVTPEPDLRIKAIVDDGTGAVVAIFNREQTEKILNMSLDEVIDKVRENLGNPSIVQEMVENKMIARPMQLRGNVMYDEKYGLRMLVKEYQFLNLEYIAQKAEKMLEEMGW